MNRKHLAIRMDQDEHREMKIMLAKKDLKFQDYVINLIRKDMENKK